MSTPRAGTEISLPNNAAQRAKLAADGSGNEFSLTAALEIHGIAPVEALQNGLHRLVERRPALRICFDTVEEHHLTRASAPDLLHVTIESSTQEDAWREIHDRARREAHTPVPGGSGPRLRATLFSASPDRHLLVLAIDPLVCDAWSANLLVDDLLTEQDTPQDNGIPEATAEDDYRAVWLARQSWLAAPEGREAFTRRAKEISGVLRHWPLATRRAKPADVEPIEQLTDIDDEVARALRQRLRKAHGSMLAVGAHALASVCPVTAHTPLALTAPVTARAPSEEGVVGHFSTDGILVIPARRGTIKEHLSALRAEVFAALLEQRLPYEELAESLDNSRSTAGLTLSLLFLPGKLSGGGQGRLALGHAEAARAAVGICPSGADVDLYMVEDPPPLDDGMCPLLRVGATVRNGALGAEEVDRLLADWVTALEWMARSDWDKTPVLTTPPT